MATEGSVRVGSTEPLWGVTVGEPAGHFDQKVVDWSNLVVVHPLPEYKYKRTWNYCWNQQNHPVDSGKALILNPINKNCK